MIIRKSIRERLHVKIRPTRSNRFERSVRRSVLSPGRTGTTSDVLDTRLIKRRRNGQPMGLRQTTMTNHGQWSAGDRDAHNNDEPWTAGDAQVGDQTANCHDGLNLSEMTFGQTTSIYGNKNEW